MEQTISQPFRFRPTAAVTSAAANDNWILKQLFGIRTLEKKIQRDLAFGTTDASTHRNVKELQARVALFDQALESANAKPARTLRVRAS
jgi:hypothetical protein